MNKIFSTLCGYSALAAPIAALSYIYFQWAAKRDQLGLANANIDDEHLVLLYGSLVLYAVLAAPGVISARGMLRSGG